MVSMNKLPADKQVQVIAALVEGVSIRATVRMTGVAKNTIVKLLTDIGHACQVYQTERLRDLPCKNIQCDEIWSFCYAKEKNVPEELKGKFGFGDVWTWTALDSDTKLVPCWHVGARDAWHAQHFMYDLASRLKNRVQLTTDGHRVYVTAVNLAFGEEVDYAMLVKLYGSDRESEATYSPSECIGCREAIIIGDPNPAKISTSHVERQNLTMRMGMRRFTRLTNAFSKKIDNHMAAISLHYMHYNFCRLHQTLGVTPAMKAGVADHVWTLAEVIGLLNRESGAVAA
jgi:IS1 family transposase